MPNLPKNNRPKYLPRRQRKPTGNQTEINTSRWRKLSKMYRQANPLCEVSLAMGLGVDADVVDHIIAREFGGAMFDERNLMALNHKVHNTKSGMETHGPFLDTVDTINGLIPMDRQQAISIMVKRMGGELVK